MSLKPFWQYYGGKFRIANWYPRPEYETIIEPFAGGAGYSLLYPERKVILIERYERVAEIWRYLIAVSVEEILRIPTPIINIDDLPSWVPSPARDLVGFNLNNGGTTPKKKATKWILEDGERTNWTTCRGWSEKRKQRVASQLSSIRHWVILQGDYRDYENVKATWFIDPPYISTGHYYRYNDIDYSQLGDWCRSRNGQVIVCEKEDASWLPFSPLGWNDAFREGIWVKEE